LLVIFRREAQRGRARRPLSRGGIGGSIRNTGRKVNSRFRGDFRVKRVKENRMREQFTTALKEAMKAGDKARLGAVRLIQAAIKDKDIEARGAGKGEASNDEILALLQKMIKQRQESATIYRQNNRPELAETEEGEIAVISSFLPKQLDEAETKAAIAAAIAETGAAGMKDMGKVIAYLKEKFTGQMDFSKASAFVKAALSG
jgi:hypothetical protein